MTAENNFKVKYYQDSNGTIRREIPKIRMSKKKRLRIRWEGKERFPITGRGHREDDNLLVIDYLRSIHPATARKVDIAKNAGLGQDRVLIILNNLSGLKDDYSDASETKEFPFLVYESDEGEYTEYGIWKDEKLGIFPAL
jgi:hypothetical protein